MIPPQTFQAERHRFHISANWAESSLFSPLTMCEDFDLALGALTPASSSPAGFELLGDRAHICSTFESLTGWCLAQPRCWRCLYLQKQGYVLLKVSDVLCVFKYVMPPHTEMSLGKHLARRIALSDRILLSPHKKTASVRSAFKNRKSPRYQRGLQKSPRVPFSPLPSFSDCDT